jgi:hypothetical protein
MKPRMVVRIRFRRGRRAGRSGRKNLRLAGLMAALLTPAAVMAMAMGMWRIAAGLNWTSSFYVEQGLFSHWQLWLGAAALLQLCSHILNRHGKSKDAATS